MCFSPIRLCLGVPTSFVQRIGELIVESGSEPGFLGAGSSELGFLGGSLGAWVPWRVHRGSGSLAGSSELGFLGGSLGAWHRYIA